MKRERGKLRREDPRSRIGDQRAELLGQSAGARRARQIQRSGCAQHDEAGPINWHPTDRDDVRTCRADPGDQNANWITTAWPPEGQEILRYQWDEVAIPYWRDLVKYGSRERHRKNLCGAACPSTRV